MPVNAKFGSGALNSLGTRAGKNKVGARTGKHKLEARVCKYKLGARAGKYKLGDRPVNTKWGEGQEPSKGSGTGKYKHPGKATLFEDASEPFLLI